MKVTIEADEVAEIVRNVFKIDGFTAIEARAKYPGGDVEVEFEKSNVAAQNDYRAGHANQLGRRSPPTPSTPPFVSESPEAKRIDDDPL